MCTTCVSSRLHNIILSIGRPWMRCVIIQVPFTLINRKGTDIFGNLECNKVAKFDNFRENLIEFLVQKGPFWLYCFDKNGLSGPILEGIFVKTVRHSVPIGHSSVNRKYRHTDDGYKNHLLETVFIPTVQSTPVIRTYITTHKGVLITSEVEHYGNTKNCQKPTP